MTNKRQAVIDEAMTWMGTPYHHEATVKGAGVDCAQLLRLVYKEAGVIDDFLYPQYPPDWMQHRSEEKYLSFVVDRAEQVEIPLPGDAVVYKVGRCFAHGAIIIEWPSIIHASNRDREVVLADGLQGWLAGREYQFWRVKGIDQ